MTMRTSFNLAAMIISMIALGIGVLTPDWRSELKAASYEPLTAENCKNGGWQSYGFKNQGDCMQYVNTGK